jgi:penicillin-binding protein 2
MLDDDVRVQGWRLGVLVIVLFGAMDLLLSRLWTVQVVNSASAQQRSEAQTTVKSRLAPARGAICDRNGLPLAENRPSFDIDFYLGDLRRDYAQNHKGRVPKIQLRPDRHGRPRSEDDIVEIVKESIQPISQTLGLSAPLNEKEIKEHFRTNPDLPYHYMTDLDFATVANFKERNFGVRGIDISQNPQREYTYGAFASHILGYVGKPDKQTEHLARDGAPYETVGRHGIEAIMDAQLQGEPGSAFQRVSSQGYTISDKTLDAQFDPPTVGNAIYLTIDARAQYIAETAFRNSGWTRGSVVVMDPRNGDVLALASFPNYDPNTFIPHISAKDWDALNNDPTTPLFNRALHGQNPGSTYKIMVALAGLQSGHVTKNTEIDCPSAIEIDDHLFHNSDFASGGTMSLVNAIKVSSDVFFYQYGIKAGIDAIDAMGARAGFGHKWGLLGDADEDAGILPGPAWMKQPEVAERLRREHAPDHWSNAQTANTAIGQGFVLCTPLQLATFLCAVANGGTVYQPRLYSHVSNYKGDTIAEIPEATPYNTLDVTPAQLKTVQEGMYDVVEEEGGTGNATAKIPGYHMGGKTGTAQHYRRVDGVKKQDLTTWFYCYGPFESPRYVTCVMVEGGTWGSTAAAPVASEIMRRLFAMDAGETETVQPLKPLAGNFNGVSDLEAHLAAAKASNTPTANGAAPSATTTADASNDDDENNSTPVPDSPPSSRFKSSGTKHAR